jgi:hypothetical protein
MCRGDCWRTIRTWIATGLLAASAVALSPKQAFAHCPYEGCDKYWACIDDCDYQWTGCYWYCSGYPEPYRSECEGGCDQQFFEVCLPHCQTDCFYFCQ